jgi:hypothetical protein
VFVGAYFTWSGNSFSVFVKYILTKSGIEVVGQQNRGQRRICYEGLQEGREREMDGETGTEG